MKIDMKLLRSLIREAVGENQSKHDWEYYVEQTASLIRRLIDNGEELDLYEITSSVFRPSPDHEVRMMRNDMLEDTAVIEKYIKKHARQYKIPAGKLSKLFFRALDATEEYMNDEDDTCPDCHGEGDCAECDEGIDTSTGRTCETCGGTNMCQTCGGSGEI